MSRSFLEAVENRRSIRTVGRASPLQEDKLVELIRRCAKYSPSAFNSQGARLLVLLGGQHEKFWNITEGILKKIVPEGRFGKTAAKLAAFRSGVGTVLVYEDQNVVQTLQKQFPLYKDHFPEWALQSSGMLQLVLWTALEEAGFGASLQHYDPLVDELVQKEWNVPSGWKLLTEIPFGSPEETPGEKSFKPLESRVFVKK
ncbi:MAG TPA: nitroreductase [Ruminococcaceae bacterium]|jgi:hypothetical protein|nr:nitroreductase [Oscillospiraceae bacterium]